jgi:2-haloacid dehalogenase
VPASTKQHAAVFDVIGTLVDLAPARDRLVGIGAPPVALEAWFQRLLHSAATASAIGGFRPFEELARASLRSTLAQLGLDPEHGDEVVGVLSRLPAFPEAAEALDLLRGEGHTVIALTNSGTAQARSLLDANELLDRFDAVVSAEDAGAYKPHRAPYELTLERLGDKRATMIAAHGWDVLGAQAVGLDGIWIDRLERRWPFPFAMPRRAADLLDAAELVLSRDVSPRAAAEGR